MEAKQRPEEFDLGMKDDHAAPPLGHVPEIHENSVESEIILSDTENIQDLRSASFPQTAAGKRAEFNAGAMTREDVESQKKYEEEICNSLNAEQGL